MSFLGEASLLDEGRELCLSLGETGTPPATPPQIGGENSRRSDATQSNNKLLRLEGKTATQNNNKLLINGWRAPPARPLVVQFPPVVLLARAGAVVRVLAARAP